MCAASEVQDIKVGERGSNHITVNWNPPEQINGDLTNYSVEVDEGMLHLLTLFEQQLFKGMNGAMSLPEQSLPGPNQIAQISLNLISTSANLSLRPIRKRTQK